MGAVEKIDEILSVPGVDATMIGPADLALDMGIPVAGDNPNEDQRALCNAVLDACQKHDVVPGIFTSGPEEGKRRAAEGWRYLPVGSDSQYMMQAAFGALRTVQG